MLSHLVDLTGMRLDRIKKLTAGSDKDTRSTKLITARHIHSKIKNFIITTYPELTYDRHTDEYGASAGDSGGSGIRDLRDIWYTARGRPCFSLMTQINSANDYVKPDLYPRYINSKLVCWVRHNDNEAFETIAVHDENFMQGEIFCVLPIKEDVSGGMILLPSLLNDKPIQQYFEMGDESVVRLNKYIRMATLEWPVIIAALCVDSKKYKFSSVKFEIKEEGVGRILYVIDAKVQTIVRLFGSEEISLSITSSPIEQPYESLLITLKRGGRSKTLVGTLEMLRRGMIPEMLEIKVEEYDDE